LALFTQGVNPFHPQDGSASQAMDPLQAGDPRQVGAYRVVGRLGGGGMGQVFLGLSPGGRPVAIKVVRPDLTADSEFRQRFAREVDAARRVGGFHTASVVDADPRADPPWMVTAYIAGPSLHAFVAGKGPLTGGATRALGAALAEGLAAIHGCGLVHRDLKPANIIMAGDGPRIIDFGIARPAGATALTTPSTVLGTYAFMSPEQFRGEAATPASDVFSLGCVLAYAATGRVPFDAASVPAIMYRVLEAEPELSEVAPGLLRDALEACLAKEPGRRPSLPDLIARFTAPAELIPGAWPQAPEDGGTSAGTVVGPHGRAERPAPGAVADVAVPGEPHAAGAPQVHADRHESITITQQANASPGSVVIQVAGNAKIGDDA
jgi:serine/threonine protein kinase